MIFGLFKISGHSMMPQFKSADRIIVSSIPYFFAKPKVGDVILFEYHEKTLVKRISKISGSSISIEGDNKDDSLEVEYIDHKQILGKVLLKL